MVRWQWYALTDHAMRTPTVAASTTGGIKIQHERINRLAHLAACPKVLCQELVMISHRAVGIMKQRYTTIANDYAGGTKQLQCRIFSSWN
jgi:hypothetical protein